MHEDKIIGYLKEEQRMNDSMIEEFMTEYRGLNDAPYI